ncbi:MAG: 3-oxoacyl-ACP synthase [Firmicutes bacterium]|nr:3-oxoacyl-ACP synthase [Bacillota bacterium]
MEKINVGIRSVGSYVPAGIRDSFYISEKSGIPEQVIREKFGIKQVHKAGPEESVADMGAKAALAALKDLTPEDLDLVVYCGSEYKDFYMYNCAARIKELIGAKNAASFEIHNLCSAGVYSLKIMRAMMRDDPKLKRVLLVSSSKEGDLINYADTESRFMFNFGDGAAAAVLERGLDRNIILESSMIVDGQFANDVYVPAVGCVNRGNCEHVVYEDRFLRVRDLADMKPRLDPITLPNFFKVMDKAVELSGYRNEDVNFVAPICMKKSMLVGLLDHFGLTEENSFLLEDYGHCQSADCFLSIEEGLRHGRLHDGDLVVTIAAGTGYTWASTCIKWGPVA